MVFTANRKPRDLYRGGPNRSYFEPFIRLLEERLVVLHVGAGTDYRRALSSSATGLASSKTQVRGRITIVMHRQHTAGHAGFTRET